MNHVGKNIKALRNKHGWNLAKVAKALGISIPALSRIESGFTDINLSRLVQLANLFEVSLHELVAEGGNPTLELMSEELRTCRDSLMERDEHIIKLQQALIKMHEDKRRKHYPDI